LLSDTDLALLGVIQHGLPLVPRPYAAVGAALGLTEEEVIARIQAFLEAGLVSRIGIVVRHGCAERGGG
jgi:DNA-binding Lrp family transcriptional regulator